jgi:hypothetical protein
VWLAKVHVSYEFDLLIVKYRHRQSNLRNLCCSLRYLVRRCHPPLARSRWRYRNEIALPSNYQSQYNMEIFQKLSTPLLLLWDSCVQFALVFVPLLSVVLSRFSFAL